jgi:hypothetical protein
MRVTQAIFLGVTMRDIHSMLSDTNLIIDFLQFPENSQGVAKIREESKEDQGLDSSSSGVVLFRGCCVV